MDAVAPPSFGEATLRDLLDEHYGVAGQLQPLPSERDQITRVETDSGQRFIFKIISTDGDSTVTDFQLQAMMHLERSGCPVAVPQVIPTVAGEPVALISAASSRHFVQLLSYVDGVLLRDARLTSGLLRSFGRRLAQLGESLRAFEHAGDRPMPLWDMQRALHLRSILQHIDDADVRQAASTALDDFEQCALPHFPELRRQVIHDDANPDNVLVNEDMSDIVGFIDFDEMVRAPVIVDVAVAASYLRSFDDDPLKFILPFVAGYHSGTELDDTELELLFDLVRTRLTTSICNRFWRRSAPGGKNACAASAINKEADAQRFLACLDEIGRHSFSKQVLEACNTSSQ